MASLATRCGERGANILALDVHPTADGEVVDELVVHTPSGWSIADVERLCAEAGVFGSAVVECSAHALEDQPVRWLRAAQSVVAEPERLEELLCGMLAATPASPDGSATLLLADGPGPQVALQREQPFTATEEARATELRLVAARATGRPATHASETVEGVGAAAAAGAAGAAAATAAAGTLRRGTVADIRALVELHDRCSAETLSRRYHSPVRRLSPTLARGMLLPDDGFSLVLPDRSGDELLAIGMVAFQDGVAEAALLVEDRWQRRGHGTDLLRAMANEAAVLGAEELTLVTRRDDTAVLATVHRVGLRAHVRCVDGANRLRVPLRNVSPAARGDARQARRRNTGPLIALLNQRSELREVYAPADFIDRAVRDGV